MRGFWYMIEAILAGIIMISFLLVLAVGYGKVPGEYVSLKGYEILHDLDQQGVLRSYVIDGNYSGLGSQIKLFEYNHSVQICDQAGNCSGSMPDAANVWIGNYYIIAGEDQYQPYLIKLYMWRL
ncbi:MAG: hypothetical protein JSW41_03005 [Candidatus Aenigmatarchaeota archaeon]|nr:MAG: hypothetical protein JSW41_03005 [Candidatus Aenigmarchaeota archaeon]